MKCRADLRVCLNCAHYDPRVAHQCRERRAEPVLEKHIGNFCEYFEFAIRDWKPKAGGPFTRRCRAGEDEKTVWGLRQTKSRSVLECDSPLPLFAHAGLKSARGLAQSKTWRPSGRTKREMPCERVRGAPF
jgi:hypothetical protein